MRVLRSYVLRSYGSFHLKLWRFITFITAIVALSTPAYAATCAPAKLVHIVTTNVTPGIVPGSFQAQPKTLYRIGNNKMRIEESPDKASAIHGLIVISEPDIWMINLYDNTGHHILDSGPNLDAVAPVISFHGVPAKITAMELGCEADYLTSNGIQPSGTEHIGSDNFTVYRISSGKDVLELLDRQGTVTPAYARYYHAGKLGYEFKNILTR